MGDWDETSLSTVVDIKHGFAFKGEYFKDALPGDILLTPGNFAIGGGFKDDKLKFYDGPVPKEYILQADDLLVTMTDLSKQADTLGYPLIVPSDPSKRYLHNQRLGKVEVKHDAKILTRFLYYLLQTSEYRHEVVNGATGTTVKHTSPTRIGQFKFRKPPLETQLAIAHILGALDDKIDLNRRMNETLEQTARALFKDWFVDFGPTKAKMAGQAAYLEGELWDLFPERLDEAGVPEGWQNFQLAEIVKHYKNTISPMKTPEKMFEHYSLPAFDNGQEPVLDSGASIKSNKTVVPGESVLLSKLNPEIPRVWLPHKETEAAQVASTEFLAFRPVLPVGRSLLFCLFSSPAFRQTLQGMVTGTSKSHQRVSPPVLLGLEVVSGSANIFRAFEGAVSPLLKRTLANHLESQTLAQIRDLLLPKLMSGELRVRDAEAQVAEVL